MTDILPTPASQGALRF